MTTNEIVQIINSNIVISKKLDNDDIRMSSGCNSIIIERESLDKLIKELMILYCDKKMIDEKHFNTMKELDRKIINFFNETFGKNDLTDNNMTMAYYCSCFIDEINKDIKLKIETEFKKHHEEIIIEATKTYIFSKYKDIKTIQIVKTNEK